jgi:hypothetical protein
MNAHVKLDKAGMDRVKGRYNQTVPMFGGNERVPVLSQVSIDHVVQLVNGATTDSHIRRAAMDLLGLMETKDWCITCGVHQGGLGGAFGEADPEPHVSLSVGTVGYHLRVLKKNNRYVLYDITGGGTNAPVSAGRAQRRKRASPPKQNWVELLQSNFALSDAEAVKAVRYIRTNFPKVRRPDDEELPNPTAGEQAKAVAAIRKNRR